jgi:hypothetical protein
MEKQNTINKLSVLESSNYYRRETYEKIVRTGRLIPIKSRDLKCINGMKTERLLELRIKSELAFICDTSFTDRDVLTIIKVHAPLDAESYTSYRYNGKTNKTLSLTFY